MIILKILYTVGFIVIGGGVFIKLFLEDPEDIQGAWSVALFAAIIYAFFGLIFYAFLGLIFFDAPLIA